MYTPLNIEEGFDYPCVRRGMDYRRGPWQRLILDSRNSSRLGLKVYVQISNRICLPSTNCHTRTNVTLKISIFRLPYYYCTYFPSRFDTKHETKRQYGITRSIGCSHFPPGLLSPSSSPDPWVSSFHNAFWETSPGPRAPPGPAPTPHCKELDPPPTSPHCPTVFFAATEVVQGVLVALP